MADWDIGHYETTALELEPAADRVVADAAIQPGERVLDIATGTGNAALRAARAGAQVTGLDAAPRLIEVARAAAEREGLDVSFVVGDAQALPFEADSFDVVLSIFGVIFAENPERALAEIVRVMRPDGRALFTAWLPEGTITSQMAVMSRAVAEVTGESRERFAWHDPAALDPILERLGARAEIEEAEIAFSAESPEDFLARGAYHPMHQVARAVLVPAGRYDEVRARALAALEEGNEDPAAFRATSRYRIVRVTR